jgi:threonine dehydrogenase-like Zn-dependent dehydrogenase
MAQYLTLPSKNLFVVPEGISDAEACFAEPVAAACRVVEQRVPRAADSVAVIGDGKLGLLLAQVLAIHNYKVRV